jgi:Protein of unknown function DUF262
MISDSSGITSNSPIDALETTLGNLLSGDSQLRIPIYQRPFTWGKKGDTACNEKLVKFVHSIGDIVLEDATCGRFFGFLVCLPKPESRVDVEPYYNVIDGQQRLTTLSLICLAACDVAEASVVGPCAKDEKEAVAEFVLKIREKFILFKKEVISGTAISVNDLRLRPARDDREAYLKLVNGDMPAADSPIANGYKIARQALEELISDGFSIKFSDNEPRIIDRIKRFFDGVEKMHVVQMRIVREELGVNSIFESINYAGERLSDYDLIRNKVIEGFEPSLDSESKYEKRWEKMEDAFREAFGSEDYERKLESFILYYLRIKAASSSMGSSAGVSASNVFKKFIELVFHTSNSDPRRQVITDAEFDEILTYSFRYLRLVRPAHMPSSIIPVLPAGIAKSCIWSDSTIYALQSFGRLGVDAPIPFLLEFVAREGTDDKVASLASTLVNFFVRFDLVGGSSRRLSDSFVRLVDTYVAGTGELLENPSSWLKDNLFAKRNRVLVRIYPTKDELVAGMKERKIQPSSRKMFKFVMIELSNRLANRFKVPLVQPDSLGSLQVVQVLPEDLTPTWRQYLSSNRLREVDAASNACKLGNLVLVPADSIGDSAGYDEIKQVISDSPLLMMRMIPGAYPVWTYDVINNRTVSLADEINKEFP